MLNSPSSLPENSRLTITSSLNVLLACSLDFYSMAKVAHWNVRGPNFSSLHELFGAIAEEADGQTDAIAERAVALGGEATGSVKEAAKTSSLAPYPTGVHDGSAHVYNLLERLKTHVGIMKSSRATVEGAGDVETANMLQDFVLSLEKYGWQLAATIG